jgi:hypothetical protein
MYNDTQEVMDAGKQRAQVLSLLQIWGSRTTHQLREVGVMSPAARVLELRRLGHVIETGKRRLPAEDGRLHVQAVYTYRGQRHA